MNKKVLFKIDKDLDFQNHLIGAKIALDNSLKTSLEVGEYFKKLREAKEEDKIGIFEERTLKFYSSEMSDIRAMLVKQTKEMWSFIESKYFNKIEKIHKRSFPLKNVYGILSTTPTVYGYNFNNENPWFACSSDSPLKAIHTAMHEIMHIYFLKYFADEYRNRFQLNNDQIYIIKESLTVLLNLEFDDIRIYPDKDKVGHEKIREKIKNDWLKYKDFEKVLEEACIYINKL